MRRSPGVLPITYTELHSDEYGNVFEHTEQIGQVESNDILKLIDDMNRVWMEVRV